MLKKRIIPCLDIKNGRTVKGVNFLGLRDAGDPIELARRYDDTKKQSKDSPEDKTLMAQVETIWDELKRRKKQTQKIEGKQENSVWLKIAVGVIAGIIIGKSLS